MDTTEFVKTYGITAKLTRIPDNPNMAGGSGNMINYSVTLQYLNRSLTTYFSTGIGWIEDLKGNMVSGFEYDLVHNKIVPSRLYGKRNLTLYDVEMATKNHRIRQPQADDILDCLASDAQGIEYARDFEDWASEYGYDTDSRMAENTYHICKQEARKLEKFLGRELYNTLINDVERL